MHRRLPLAGLAALAALQTTPAAHAQHALAATNAPAPETPRIPPCAFVALEPIPSGTTIRFIEDARTPRPGFADAADAVRVTRTFEWTALDEIAVDEVVPLDGDETARWTWNRASERPVAYSVVLGHVDAALLESNDGTGTTDAHVTPPTIVWRGTGGSLGGSPRVGAAAPAADVAPFVFTPTSTTTGAPLGRPRILPVARCGGVRANCGGGISVNGCTPLLIGSGVPSATATSGYTLTAIAMDGLRPAGMFYGLRQQPAQIGLGTSYFCDGSVHQRIRGAWSLSSGSAGSCDGAISVDLNAELSTHPGWHGAPFAFGQVLYVQSYNRDPGNPSASINVSEGLAVTLCF